MIKKLGILKIVLKEGYKGSYRISKADIHTFHGDLICHIPAAFLRLTDH